jgi:NAD(P)H-dependent flavin oxidoreductase YrpB (nitropropane dioxygenase family)
MTQTSSTEPAVLPAVIQGGMGVAVSDWRLANAVARLGQLGVVSGTALDVVHTRRLADGDPGGHLRRAYRHFPVPELAERVLARWLVPGGRQADSAYRHVPRSRLGGPAALGELTVLANFAEVWLAKEGHSGPVGVNYLEKIQLPIPTALYGALLAGVDYVLVGAGIPADIPRLLDGLAAGLPVSYRITVAGAAPADHYTVDFDPATVFGAGAEVPALSRPRFLAIVSSNTLASFLAKDPATAPDGFVVEDHCAGGHNAPPRGRLQLDGDGQPVYGPRDRVDFEALRALGRPFWLAGGYAEPGRLIDALDQGAAGVQVGTAFAWCEESAIAPELKQATIAATLAGDAGVVTDPHASPSGYPFKVVGLPGTLSEPEVYEQRRRLCDLGFLRTPYKTPDGTVGYRCASEPVADYVRKGGSAEDTAGRKCLCNGLLATVGLGQQRRDCVEPPLVTSGDDLARVVGVLGAGDGRWTAADVIAYLLPDSAGRNAPSAGGDASRTSLP